MVASAGRVVGSLHVEPPIVEEHAVSGPIVNTRTGPVLGTDVGDLSVFRGIPFAAPPLGELRFAPPQPPEPWTAPLDATTFGASAPQNLSLIEEMLGSPDVVYDEDCLRLNVWTPGCDAANRPVLVWIHGGGFLTGSGSIPWYEGSHLAARDAVVVTINYRLGVLGFLHLEELGDGFEGSGNAGLLDQIAALRWVHDNIAGFGGDPANVTVFGESAGAMSVGTLLGTSQADGLFGRAILQSGACSHVHDAGYATEVARKFLAEVGADLSQLRSIPVATLMEAQQRVASGFAFEDGLPFEPVVDGTVLPRQPLERVAAGQVASVELLLGTTLEEMNMFLLMDPALAQLDEAAVAARVDAFFVPHGQEPGHALAAYRERLAAAPVSKVLSAVLTDHTFRMPAIRLAEAQAAHQPSVRMYLFTFATEALGGALGACHALEVPFVWDNLDAQGAALFVGDVGPGQRALAARMADAWVSFARDGHPVVDGLPVWPAYDTAGRSTVRFDVDEIEVLEDPMSAEREVWTGIGL
ncbi:MAG: carboxylesterase/lipase family protein [Actinomycetota bacterium]|nr:carboxylesterase/lipase family protein [Actinomycetota bacterium]